MIPASEAIELFKKHNENPEEERIIVEEVLKSADYYMREAILLKHRKSINIDLSDHKKLIFKKSIMDELIKLEYKVDDGVNFIRVSF